MSSDDEIDIEDYQHVPENRVYIGKGPVAVRNHFREKYRDYRISVHESRDVDSIFVGDPPVLTLGPLSHSHRMTVTISCDKGTSRTFSDPKDLLLYLEEILDGFKEEGAPFIHKKSKEALDMLRLGLRFALFDPTSKPEQHDSKE